MSVAHPVGAFGLQDLVDAPDDGYRYEVLDGALVVNPAPSWRHQEIAANLRDLLHAAAPEGLAVLPAPAWQIAAHQVPEPDVVVVERTRLGEIAVEGTPLLVVEVLSPSNRGSDLVRKRALYAEAGCPDYWIVDPQGPAVTILRLVDDRYVEVAVVPSGAEITLDRPYAVRLRPSDL